MDFDYKKYSLEKLEEWVHDAMSSDASPHEIYSTIREVVRENYNYHREQVSRAYGLLELLSGHRPVEDKELFEAAVAEREYYEGVDESFEEILKREGYEWTPPVEGEKSKYYYEYDRNDANMKNPFIDKVKKWVLPVEQVYEDYIVSFPDDLLKAANLKEGDQVEWVDQGDGSYLLRKVNPPAWHPV